VIAPLLVALVAPAPPVVVTATARKVILSAGQRGEIEVVATIRKGFRIQANPASLPFLVPSLLEFDEHEHVDVGSPEYPPGEPHRLRGTTEDLSVYAGRLAIRVPVTARRGSGRESSDDVVLVGRLRYQACNEEVCLRPSSVPVLVPVSLRPPPTDR
jgi:hypothetical protein